MPRQQVVQNAEQARGNESDSASTDVSVPKLARQIRIYMKNQGLSGKEVAERLHIYPSALSRFMKHADDADDAPVPRYRFIKQVQQLLADVPQFQSRRKLLNLCELFRERLARSHSPNHRIVVIVGGGAAHLMRHGTESWRKLARTVLDAASTAFADRAAFYEEVWQELNSMEEVGLPEPSEDLAMTLHNLIEERTVRTEHVCGALWTHPVARQKMVDELVKAFGPAPGDTAGDRPQRFAELASHLARHGFIDVFLVSNIDATLSTSLTDEMGPDGFEELFLQEAGGGRTTSADVGLKLVRLHGRVDRQSTLFFPPVRERRMPLPSAALLDEIVLRHGQSLGRATIISLGYGWEDQRLASWVRSRAKSIEAVYVVRAKDELPRLLQGPIAAKCHVISTSDLARPKRRISLDDFVWAVCEYLQDRAAGHKEGIPRITPIARHLILSHLFGERSRKGVPSSGMFRNTHGVEERLVAEIILHACKAKGMVNTAVLCDDRRVRRHLVNLPEGPAEILERCRGFLARSRFPQAADTFFLKATEPVQIADYFRGDVFNDLCRLKSVANDGTNEPIDDETVAVPKIRPRGDVEYPLVSVDAFFRAAIDDIFRASETEVTPGIDRQAPFIFTKSAQPIRSHGALREKLTGIIAAPWTHLFIVTEWSRLHRRELGRMLESETSRKVFLLEPSHLTLDDWHLRHALLADRLKVDNERVFGRQIAWWKHNQHFTLAVENGVFKGATYALRRLKRSMIEPYYLSDERDCAGLLCSFLNYLERATDELQSKGERASTPEPDFRREVVETARRVSTTYGEGSEVAQKLAIAIEHCSKRDRLRLS